MPTSSSSSSSESSDSDQDACDKYAQSGSVDMEFDPFDLMTAGNANQSDSNTSDDTDDTDNNDDNKDDDDLRKRFCRMNTKVWTRRGINLQGETEAHKPGSPEAHKSAVNHWKKFMMISKKSSDPWEEFHVEDNKIERAKRYRWKISGRDRSITLSEPETKENNVFSSFVPLAMAKKRSEDLFSKSAFSLIDEITLPKHHWVKDDCLVKIQKTSFDEGAMRRCYRMKKVSQSTMKCRLSQGSSNYVIKEYKKNNLDRQQYFDDVIMQSEAEYWANIFNSNNPPPPKSIDMIQTLVLELVDRDPVQAFGAERFIEGSYIKHNSNAGYVEGKFHRLTPQCFSHFTFSKTKASLMVVDVQGVGDLYTDPQILTHNKRFGKGDLGYFGMALFLGHHHCSEICTHMGIEPFDLSPSQQERIKIKENRTMPCNETPNINTGPKILDISLASLWLLDEITEPNRIAYVHLSFAKAHCQGEFTDQVPDASSALYHLHRAAKGGVLRAIVSLAKFHSGLGSDSDALLPEGGDSVCDVKRDLSPKLWKAAAARGSVEAMIQVAQFYHKYSNEEQRNYSISRIYYEKAHEAIKSIPAEQAPAISIAVHDIISSLADIYKNGGHGIVCDIDKARMLYTEAAEKAMSNKDHSKSMLYYKLAEECHT